VNVADYGVIGDGVTMNQVEDGTSGPWIDFQADMSAHNLSAAVDVTLTVGSTTVVNWPNHGQPGMTVSCFCRGRIRCHPVSSF
jgi:hypothetical protein